MKDLRPFFAPRSVAVVGAGERPSSSGGAVLQNLRISRYAGATIPVNPKGGEIFGVTARRSLKELDEPADLVVIVIRPDAILEAVREAAESGHRNILVLPGGFAEAGEEGNRRDAALRALATEKGLTIAGPNCAGIIHLGTKERFAATFLRDMPPGPGARGALAMVSQSGALVEEVIAAANGAGIPVATLVSVGNAMQLGIEEFLEHLADDPGTSAILLYIESFGDAARFRRIARHAAAKKPLVALIGGRTGPGARAAAAHTGAPANDDAALDAFCAESGVLRVKSLRHLLLAAKGFGFFPKGLPGGRVLLLSNSGGPGVICTDMCAAQGLALPPLPAAMAAQIRAAVPAEASVANPLDLLADAREDRFGLALDAAIAHGGGEFDAILGIHVVPFMVDADPVVARLAATGSNAPVPMMHAMMGTLERKAAWFASLEAAGIPAFNDVEEMAECAALLARWPELKTRAAIGGEPPVTVRDRAG